MGQALYRKYRSKSFDEVVGQDHITKTLAAAIKAGRINHAYLFTGPRGVGKTSVARILAHAVNELPYSGEGMHLDIIEIDAASNRRIDEIRDLRDKVHTSPTSAKYKVYIIDEVHMLTREAFNALLKTLEEPPAHVIFILATTEAHKLPETIISRTQRYNFKAVGQETAYHHLAQIAKNEKVDVEEGALRLLAEFGDGSFRDSIGLLDQLAATGKKVTETLVREHLGLPKSTIVEGLLEACRAGDMRKLLQMLSELRDQAVDPSNVAKLLADLIRLKIVENEAVAWHTALLKQLSYINSAQKPFDGLEIALLEAASGQVPKVKTAEEQIRPAAKIQQPPNESNEKKVNETKKPAQDTKTENFGANFDLTMWEEVLGKVKQEAPALYTAMRLAVPAIDEGKLTLAFEFPLHQKKVNQAQHKETIGRAVEHVSGSKITVVCVIDKQLVKDSKGQQEPSLYVAQPDAVPPSSLQTISNIFGSAEMLES